MSTYSVALRTFREKFNISEWYPLSMIAHENVKAVYTDAQELCLKVQAITQKSCRIGGSCFMKNGRSFLLKSDDIDIDINIWVSPTEDIPGFLPQLTELFGRPVALEPPEAPYLGTVKAEYPIAGRATEIHLKFRDEKDAAKKSLVETRHDLMTDDDYLLYMNLKYQLKKRGGPDYEEFKKLEMAALKA